MESSSKTSFYPFIIVGLIAGIALALLIPHNAFGIFSYFPKNKLHLRVFFYFWVGFYAFLFLLAYSHKRSLTQLIFTTLLSSLIVSLPFYWRANNSGSQFLLLLFFAQAINAFHIHYQKNRFQWHYPTLFLAVWDTFVRLYIAFIFTLICFIIINLCAHLFSLIGIQLIERILSKNWFGTFYLTIFLSIGLFIADLKASVVQQNRSVILIICKYLLLPLSIIGILFVASSIVVALQHHTTPNSSYTFLFIAFLSLIFLNAVYQDGSIENPYPRFIAWICRIFIILTPVFSVFALYAIYFYGNNSIKTLGLNTDNIAFTINAGLLLAYNLSYAVIAIFRKKDWMRSLESINLVLAAIMIVAALTTTSPYFMRHFHKPAAPLKTTLPR